MQRALVELRAAVQNENAPEANKKKPPRSNSIIRVMGKVLDMSERIGIDIGGTLAKIVFTQRAEEECDIAERFGQSGRHHSDLSFELRVQNKNMQFHFLSGSTDMLEKVLNDQTASAKRRSRRVVASGGGAHRYAQVMQNVLGLELLPFQEMESLVSGLDFLHRNHPPGEVFMVGESDQELPTNWPDPFLPCLLVNMGSGVSVLRIDKPGAGPEQETGVPSFKRMGGTACGGATFLGLARFITSARTFDEALELAKCGNATRVNKLVGDIYGEDGCKHLGMPANLTAACFGKLVSETDVHNASYEADRAAALLRMVVQESVVLARAFSMMISDEVGHAPPVFFVGGFLAENPVARSMIQSTFQKFDLGQALFLRHADFLGALGSLGQCLDNPRRRSMSFFRSGSR